MSILIRAMKDADARAFWDVHHAAVRGIAAADYPDEIIADWAPLPITERHVVGLLAQAGNEVRVIAERDGSIVGIGCLVPKTAEIRACYVTPEAARMGVGTAVVRELESIARGQGLATLTLNSSVTAEPFYAALGYGVVGRANHALPTGRRMACVKMTKTLAGSGAGSESP